MRIDHYGPGAVFTSKDFLDLGARDAADQAAFTTFQPSI